MGMCTVVEKDQVYFFSDEIFFQLHFTVFTFPCTFGGTKFQIHLTASPITVPHVGSMFNVQLLTYSFGARRPAMSSPQRDIDLKQIPELAAQFALIKIANRSQPRSTAALLGDGTCGGSRLRLAPAGLLVRYFSRNKMNQTDCKMRLVRLKKYVCI